MHTTTGETWTMTRGESLLLLRELADESADGVVTDPPYSSGAATTAGRKAGSASKYIKDAEQRYSDFVGDQRDQRSWTWWMTEWILQAYRVLRPNSPIVVSTDWRQYPTVSDALQIAGFYWDGVITWHKTGGGARSRLGRHGNECEFFLVGYKDGPGTREVNSTTGRNAMPGFIQYNPVNRKLHATGKPLPVMEHVVRLVGAGGVVIDPFAGSGSTGAACIRLGYRFVGFELTPAYYDIAVRRLQIVETTGEDMWTTTNRRPAG